MAEFKIVIADPKSRKAYQKEIDQAASGLLGKKLGEKISGETLGLEGYSLELTGGSDKQGFPMRKDVEGQGRKRIILTHPPGFHPERKGQRKRKSIRGNTISEGIMQVNLKVTESGKKSLEELLGAKKKEEKPKEGDKKEEPKKEEKKEEVKKEAPKEVVKEEKPAEKKETPKEEPKKETPKEEEAGQEKAEEKMGVKKLGD